MFKILWTTLGSLMEFHFTKYYLLQVHDRAQVFVSCPSGKNGERPTYIGAIERWSNRPIGLPSAKCASTFRLLILV